MIDLRELHDRTIASLTPKQGSVWLHKKGTKYTVLMLTNMDGDRGYDAEFPPTVVYKGEDGRVWSRPLSRWHGSFTELKPCRSPYCECEAGACTHSGCYDARSGKDEQPFGYVLKTGHGNAFVDTLDGIHPDAHKHWVAVSRVNKNKPYGYVENDSIEDNNYSCK